MSLCEGARATGGFVGDSVEGADELRFGRCFVGLRCVGFVVGAGMLGRGFLHHFQFPGFEVPVA